MRKPTALLVLLVLLLAAAAPPVSAHAGDRHGAGLWGQWSFDPLVLLAAALTGLIYVRGWAVLARRSPQARPPRWRAWTFAGGLLILVLALVSPLDALAGQLFSAHMVQHTLLMLAAAPLLALSLPLTPLLLGLPKRLQQALGNVWRSAPGVRLAWRSTSKPLVAGLLLAAVLWGWHAPGPYTAAVENDLVHAVQHLSFLASSLLFWWVVRHTYGARPERRGTGVVYLFVTALHSGLLGALLTFSPRVWYPVYAGRAEAWGLSALADQQLAGVIMWVPAGLVFLAAALAMLKAWIDSVPAGEAGVPQKEVE